jgi:eukaryotic-like serine/threonine-protein kinase
MKYETAVPLGRGAMGDVFKAYDPTLQRFVALKYLRRDEPELAARLLREARLQARVDHEAVCKVYEVGTDQGRPFIAMQYIDGPTLEQAAVDMTLREKLAVMKDVSEAVHAAHQTGLIHRDLKPQNILVERCDAGWKPHVLDFGLAREHDAYGLTQTGVILGTPSYMAPEQARGDVHHLDRRTDVYGLGALLYRLLAGRPPFEGSDLDVAMQVVHADPLPLRRIDPSLPVPVETIAAKCLEKEPERRYPTARALADDLQRFLSGETVRAAPPTLRYRLGRALRRQRLVASVVLVAAALLAGLSGVAVEGRLDARRQASAVLRFGQEVQKIESTLREAYLLPLHDTRREKQLVRARMKTIETEMAVLGAVGQAPGHWALGRGYLALREYTPARQHLERAWTMGYQAPEVAQALARVMGGQYQSAFEEVQRIGDRNSREARQREIESDLRDPALRYLRMGAPAEGEAPAYVEGLIAFCEKRYQDAMAKAREAGDRSPELYDASVLEGDAAVAEAKATQERGDVDGARRLLDRAGVAFDHALAVARSDPEVYGSQCARWVTQAAVEFDVATAGAQGPFARGLPFCTHALEADAESVSACVRTAAWHAWHAEWTLAADRDPRADLDAVTDLAARAFRLDPENALAHEYLGGVSISTADWEARRGIDPRPRARQGILQYRAALRLQPSARTYNGLGSCYRTQARYEGSHGLDPRAALRQAIVQYEAARRLEPSFAYAAHNLGNAWQGLAEYEAQRGGDPSASVEQAVAAHRRAIDLSPRMAWAYNDLGAAYSIVGTYALARGDDPRPGLENAIAAYRKTTELDPGYAAPFANILEAETFVAQYLVEVQGDPGPALARGRGALDKGRSVQPDAAYFPVRAARLELTSARAAGGGVAAACFEKALAEARRATVLNHEDAESYRVLAEIHRYRAQWRLGRGQKAEPDLAAGRAAVARARAIDGESAEALVTDAALHLLSRRGERDADRREALARQAEDLLAQAVEKDPLAAHAVALLRAGARTSHASAVALVGPR